MDLKMDIIPKSKKFTCWGAGWFSSRVLAQGLRSLRFKPLSRHPVVEVNSSFTSSSCSHKSIMLLIREQNAQQKQQTNSCNILFLKLFHLSRHCSGLVKINVAHLLQSLRFYLQKLQGVIGPNKTPSLNSQTVVLNFWPDRVTGSIYPEANNALSLSSKSAHKTCRSTQTRLNLLFSFSAFFRMFY